MAVTACDRLWQSASAQCDAPVSVRSLLLLVVSSFGCGVPAVVHRPVEPLNHTIPAGGGQRWHQGEHCSLKYKTSTKTLLITYFNQTFFQVHGQKAVWEDPVEWVRGTLPWPNAQQDQSRLFHLPPPSVGPQSEEKKPPKDTPPPSTLESDPLVREKR